MLFTNEQDEIAKAAIEYIGASAYAFLATSYGGKPFIRTVAPFAIKGMDVYFSAMKKSAKMVQITENPSVTLLFQQENQEQAKFKNATVFGHATVLQKESEIIKAANLLGEKEPWFKKLPESGELANIAIIKVAPEKIQYLDFARGHGKDAIFELVFDL
jgi:general stress protein 26